MLTAASSTVMVAMPAGVGLGADKLSVVTSIDQATPAASGALTISSYVNGVQLAIARSPAGNPMMMGWIDATHTTISAATTAHVFAYFALNGALMLDKGARQALIAEIPTAVGIGALETAVQTELAVNVDAFAAPNAVMTQAVADFAAPYYVNAQASAAAASGRKKALGIAVTPDAQSGIEVLQDPPFAAHLTNSFRRRAYAFVDRVSHTTAGVDVADAAAMTDFEVPPVIGVNGGLAGTVADIIAAYYGNQPTAYASVTAPASGTFSVPLVSGSDKTTYQVTVVGPGLFAGVSDSLTPAQSAALTDVALRGFVKDFMVPTLANVILGSGAVDFTEGQGTSKAQFLADVLTSVTTDFIAFVPSVPGLRDKIVAGQWYDAAVDLTNTASASNTLRTILVKGFKLGVDATNAVKFKTGPVAEMFKSFNFIMNAVGCGLQAYDSNVYIGGLAQSDRADQWNMVVTPEQIALNPPTSIIDVGGTVVLTATALGVEDTAGYSYHWTTTTQVGDLSEIAGASRTHQTDFCSSSNEALFVYEPGATAGATDTVTVQVYAGSACDPARGALLGSKQATVTFGNPWVGTWLGSVTSTCGFYSGTITYFIASGGGNVLNITYTTPNFGGGYSATFNGNSATGAGGLVSMTLNGNTITGSESDSCQTSSFTRQ